MCYNYKRFVKKILSVFMSLLALFSIPSICKAATIGGSVMEIHSGAARASAENQVTVTSFGPDHPNVAIDLNNLATLFQATNRLSEAEPLYRRALAIDEASLGPDHPNVATQLKRSLFLIEASSFTGRAENRYSFVIYVFLSPIHRWNFHASSVIAKGDIVLARL